MSAPNRLLAGLPASAAAWGGIGGTLAQQQDVQEALDSKASAISLEAHVAAADAHPAYLTPAEAGSLYAPIRAAETLPPLARRVTLVGFGNSHMAANPGVLGHLASQGGPWVLRKNAGIGGNTSQMLRDRVAADVPAGTDVCLLVEGTNTANAIASGTTTTVADLANWDAIVADLRGRGIRPMMMLAPPTGPLVSYSWAVHQIRLSHLLWAERAGIPVYDPYRVVIDPLNGFYISGASADGLHLLDAAAADVAVQLWSDIRQGQTASLAPTSNEDRGISGTTKNALLLTDTDADGVADGWTKGSTGVVALASAAADGLRGNWMSLTVTALTAQAWVRMDRNLPRLSQGADLADEYHLQLGLSWSPSNNASLTVGIEWRSLDGVTLIGSQTLIGGLASSVKPIRLQYRVTAPAGAQQARVIVSQQKVLDASYSGVLKVAEARLISVGQALGAI